ncbi:hypothetical protein GQ55_5G299600 [Panicum hallii var. hallii]|uniref:Uncharacterized protein n=1 Tax=Panicum hallii var. hallii TaxID=1504633 RepID=A0A2T7DLH0_9POAL|nr:hypothetical protein GQ55_5G299600 [Panicum hallii var. hallii]
MWNVELHIIPKTLVFLNPLAHISHQRLLFYNFLNICLAFICEGNPKGLKTISTGVPSCK